MAAKSTKTAKKDIVLEDTTQTEITEPQTQQDKAYRVVKTQIDPHTVVTVRNGFQGLLVYRSRKTGDKYEWQEFGAEQDMEFQELRQARNSDRAFFENNWFLIDDPEIIEALNVGMYYKNALNFKNFDSIFTASPSAIAQKLAKLSNGQKKSVAFRARQLISENKIDSLGVIDALEKGLSITLIDR